MGPTVTEILFCMAIGAVAGFVAGYVVRDSRRDPPLLEDVVEVDGGPPEPRP